MSLPKDTERDPRADALLTSALSAADGVEADGCPDAEVIGLYAERELAGAERRAVEAHVHACPRCRATVAAFVRALPDESAEVAGAVAGAGEASAGGGFAAWFAGWRWLVPAASLTAVALVAVWVGRGPAEQVAESARGAAAMAETDLAGPAAQAVPARQAEAFVPQPGTSASAPAGAAMADRRATSAARVEARREVAGVLADRAAAANKIAPGRTPAADASREVAAEAAPVQEPLTVTQAPAAPAARAIAPPPPAAAPAVAGGSAPAPATASGSAAVRIEASAEQRARPGDVLGASDSTLFRVSPAASFRLREGTIERTADQGATWQRAALPAGVTVLAIASPAPNVCWAVAANAVLRATDGATFTREPVPTNERLTTITATDAMRAVVTAASGARFATTNGGRTWTPAP